MTELLDGKKIAGEMLQSLRKEISTLLGRKPGLAFLRVGENPSSKVYIGMKKKKCAEVGIVSFDKELPEAISQTALISEIEQLNDNPLVDGILLQLPLPSHLDTLAAISSIDPKKDVDGFHPMNMGKLLLGDTSGFIPCTPLGIHTLLLRYGVPIEGKHVVIVGRSNIVGKPLAAMLSQKGAGCNATVTLCHSYSENLPAICRSADILIAAMGSPHFIRSHMVKDNAVVVDVGINKIQGAEGKIILAGDVDFTDVAPKCTSITPVPGGIGPMTIASLLANTLRSFRRHER